VHAADRNEVVVELDDGVRVAGAQDVLAESAACRRRARLAAFDLLLGFFWRCGGDAGTRFWDRF
jgi:hypothetical protein